MKKSSCAKFLASILLFTGLCSVSLVKTPVVARAKEYTKQHTVSLNLDGAGKKETVTFTPGKAEYERYQQLSITVNRKKIKTIKASFFSYSYKLLTLSNGKTFLYLSTSEENDDGLHHIYRYQSGKLSRVLDFNKNVRGCRWVDKIKVSGNRLIATLVDSEAPGLGVTTFLATYIYKDGKLKRESNTLKVKQYTNFSTGESGILVLTTKQSFRLYSDSMCLKYTTSVPVGTHLKVTKTFRKGIYVNMYVTGDGYSGWYCGDECDYNYYFDGVSGVA